MTFGVSNDQMPTTGGVDGRLQAGETSPTGTRDGQSDTIKGQQSQQKAPSTSRPNSSRDGISYGTRSQMIPRITSNPASNLASPTVQSPTSSLIFERNVQEPVSPHDPTPAIPAHIMNEDRIPPALEASSRAITDARLDPDEVEIVTHTAHQPAAASMSENLTSSTNLSDPHSPISFSRRQSNAVADQTAPASSEVPPSDDAGLNYGSIDPNDVRRLSFISFADVVQGEHVGTGSASAHSGPLPAGAMPSTSPGVQTPISIKPPHSPIAGQAVSPTVPPGASAQWSTDNFPHHSGTQSPQQHGALAIETMTQALRKTTSKDLGGVSSPAKSPSMSPTRPVGGRSP